MRKLIVFSNLSPFVSAISPSLIRRKNLLLRCCSSANSQTPNFISYGAAYTLKKLFSRASAPLEVPEIWTAQEVDPPSAPPEIEVRMDFPPPRPDAPDMPNGPNPPTPTPPPPDVPFPRPPQVEPPFPKPGPPNPPGQATVP